MLAVNNVGLGLRLGQGLK